MLGNRPESAAYHKFEVEFRQLQEARDRFKAAKLVQMQDEFRLKTAAYLQDAWHDLSTGTGEERGINNYHGLRRLLVRRWVLYLKRMTDAPDAVFVAWRDFGKLSAKDFAARAPQVVAKLRTASHRRKSESRGRGGINAVIQQAFMHQPPKSMQDVAAAYGKLLAEAEHRWKKLTKDTAGGKQPSALPDPAWEELRQTLYRQDGPGIVAAQDLRRVLDLIDRQQLARLQNKVEALRINSPAAPPRGMVLNDSPIPVEPVIFIRGNPGRPGKQVSRHFLQAVGEFGVRPFRKGSGRLELAQDIASPQNPLTARVIVNRVWMHHFGAGIVRTASDFGIRGTPPSHPELLDYLASHFMQEGWSLKKLHRQILLSAAYEQASVMRPDQEEKDPENKLLWRMNPTRLEFEPMRDAWLAVAADLDARVGGRGFDIQSVEPRGRRSVYAFIDRQDLPQVFRTFDFASPDVSTPQRPQTTIPQQALFAMNSTFLQSQARALARLATTHDPMTRDPAARVRNLYRRVYARDPSTDETESALAYVNGATAGEPADDVESVWHYGYGSLDLIGKRVSEFHPFPKFVKDRWGGAKLPDPRLGWVHLTATGGHPGADAKHCAIRRWVSPLAADIEIHGTLRHPSEEGDGVRGWIISSRQGCLKTWSVKDGSRETSIETLHVKPGEKIDFVVDCVQNENNDGFAWAPVIRTKQLAGSAASVTQLWHSTNDFSGPAPPRLNPWEQLAQALLVSNEFVFID